MEHWQDWRTGQPKHLADLWAVTKGTHRATCVLVGHPMGAELRVEIDGDLRQSEAFRDSTKAVAAAQDWRKRFEEKGWSASL
jgi:hypothetical protein